MRYLLVHWIEETAELRPPESEAIVCAADCWEAIAIASQRPIAKIGSVEVRALEEARR